MQPQWSATTEAQAREVVEQVRRGRLSRRRFIAHLGALGVAMPMASMLLADAGLAQTASPPYPTRRGGGGPLRPLFWRGPTLLNPHFATGTKDSEGSYFLYEGLAHWDADDVQQPRLAAEIPSRENGGVAADGLSVTWKFKRGVAWHERRALHGRRRGLQVALRDRPGQGGGVGRCLPGH